MAKHAVYNGMHNLVRASNGDIYISDTRNNLIRKIDGNTNLVSTMAGCSRKERICVVTAAPQRKGAVWPTLYPSVFLPTTRLSWLPTSTTSAYEVSTLEPASSGLSPATAEKGKPKAGAKSHRPVAYRSPRLP